MTVGLFVYGNQFFSCTCREANTRSTSTSSRVVSRSRRNRSPAFEMKLLCNTLFQERKTGNLNIIRQQVRHRKNYSRRSARHRPITCHSQMTLLSHRPSAVNGSITERGIGTISIDRQDSRLNYQRRIVYNSPRTLRPLSKRSS